jgi:hypothetical protein
MTTKPITDLDFDTIKASLRTYLKGQDRFKDYDFEGSNMSVLLDILAYNTYHNNFYTNMMFAEMFLDSAQDRDSINSHAKSLNYTPRSVRVARANIDVTLSVAGTPSFITIPRYTKFTSRAGTKTFPFVTLDSYTVVPENGVYCIRSMPIYQGKVVSETFSVSGNLEQKFKISSDNVDTSTIRVMVRDSAEVDSRKTEYVLEDSIIGVKTDDKVFYVEADDGGYSLTFGRNLFGASPVTGNIVEVTYLVTEADEANGLNSFSATDTISGYAASVVTVSKSYGGAPIESLDSIRFFAPRAAQIQERAVTESDYGILLKNRFPEVQAVAVYGGETLDPPQYGKVFVAVDVKNADGVSANAKTRFRQFLQERNPLTIEPVIINPEFLFVSVDTTIYYNTETTAGTAADIRSYVSKAILDFSDSTLADFNKTLRFSKLLKAIDESDASIMSNNTQVRAILEISPEFGKTGSYVLDFKNRMKNSQPLSFSDSAANHTPVIKSSSFVYKGASGFFMDDGIGGLYIVRISDDKFVPLLKNAGTVDYETGKLTISEFEIDSYTGTGIKFYARTAIDDITSPKTRIISIRDQDVNITVLPAKE